MKRNWEKEGKDYFPLISINYEFDKLDRLDYSEAADSALSLQREFVQGYFLPLLCEGGTNFQRTIHRFR